MFSNGNSFNGGSNYALSDVDDPSIATLPWWFRHQVPSFRKF